MFRSTKSVFLLAPTLLAVGVAAAEPDILRGAIDPYQPGLERGRFIQSTGVDSDLDEKEFTAGTETTTGFVRPFDKWTNVRRFDRNKDTRIDWFEADSYRKALRNAVLAKYDADGNNKLEGDERVRASQDLTEGKVPPLNVRRTAVAVATDAAAPPPAAQNLNITLGPQGFIGQLPPEAMQWLDTDGDGQISQPERIRAMMEVRSRAHQEAARQFDTDGDGVVSDAEWNATPSYVRFIKRIDDLGVKTFDEDGDGDISEFEMVAMDDFFQKAMIQGQQQVLLMLDTNGDGQVDAGEQAQFQGKMQAAFIQVMPKALSWADNDGDGQATPQEWLGLFDRFTVGFESQVERYTQTYDTDGDGRLNAAERDAFLIGAQEEDRQRYLAADADGDGQLNAYEWANLFENAAGEFGIGPAR